MQKIFVFANISKKIWRVYVALSIIIPWFAKKDYI